MKNLKPFQFDSETKYYTYEDKLEKIEEMKKENKNGLKELIDAVNSVDIFFVVSQNEGFMKEEKSHEMPSINFFVLYDQYEIANRLMLFLIGEFGSTIECSTEYHSEYNIENNYVIDNGIVIVEYIIHIEECMPQYFKTKYDKLVNHISNYAKKVNRSERLIQKNEFQF